MMLEESLILLGSIIIAVPLGGAASIAFYAYRGSKAGGNSTVVPAIPAQKGVVAGVAAELVKQRLEQQRKQGNGN